MTHTADNIRFFARITTSEYCILEDLDLLKDSLETENVEVEVESEWRPAFCTGIEFLLDIAGNLNWTDIIVSGIAYDAIKFLLKRIFAAVKVFIERNRHDDFFPVIKIRLGEVTIVLHNSPSTEEQTELFDNISFHLGHILASGDSKHGISSIKSIEVIDSPGTIPDLLSDDFYPGYWEHPISSGWLIEFNDSFFLHYDPATLKTTSLSLT